MRKPLVLVTQLVLAAALAGSAAAGLSPSIVKGGTDHEQRPAASTTWFAWTQAAQDRPNRPHVWAEEMPIGSTTPFRVNPAGTKAFTGGIDGSELVYQELVPGDSDIRLTDLGSGPPLTITSPAGVNTDRWEWGPTITTDTTNETWILFGRQNSSTGVQRIIAVNLDDPAASRELEMTTNWRHALIPGQVNGDRATWTSCRPNCHVRYVNLVDGSPIETVPRPSYVTHQYAPSVADDGTLYYVRSGDACGANVRVMRRDTGGTQLLVDLPDRRDIFTTHVSDEGLQSHLYYDRMGCGSGAWDIYRLID